MRSIINILDLSAGEIDQLIAVADDIMAQPEKYNEVCRHKILATLFFEPSTRTRLSFESAMLSLGGQVIGFSGADSSSAVKGETIADTIEVVNGYADIIAKRDRLLRRHHRHAPPERGRAGSCIHAHGGAADKCRRRRAFSSHADARRPADHSPRKGYV